MPNLPPVVFHLRLTPYYLSLLQKRNAGPSGLGTGARHAQRDTGAHAAGVRRGTMAQLARTWHGVLFQSSCARLRSLGGRGQARGGSHSTRVRTSHLANEMLCESGRLRPAYVTFRYAYSIISMGSVTQIKNDFANDFWPLVRLRCKCMRVY